MIKELKNAAKMTVRWAIVGGLVGTAYGVAVMRKGRTK